MTSGPNKYEHFQNGLQARMPLGETQASCIVHANLRPFPRRERGEEGREVFLQQDESRGEEFSIIFNYQGSPEATVRTGATVMTHSRPDTTPTAHHVLTSFNLTPRAVITGRNWN